MKGHELPLERLPYSVWVRFRHLLLGGYIAGTWLVWLERPYSESIVDLDSGVATEFGVVNSNDRAPVA